MQPLLADQVVDAIIAVVVLGISFIGWLVNYINQSKATPPPSNAPRNRPSANRPAANRPGNSGAADEIEVFLDDDRSSRGTAKPKKPNAAQGQRPKPPPPPRKAPAKQAPPSISKPLSQQSAAPQLAGAPSQEGPPPADSLQRRRPGGEVAARQAPGSKNLGKTVQQQAREMQSHVEQDVRHLQPKVSASVDSHLGAFSAPLTVQPAPPVTGAIQPDELTKILRQPASIRHAMIVNILLSKPLGLKRRDGG